MAALFTEKEFGKPISRELSEYISAHTNKYDRAEVARKTGISTSTLRDVTYGFNSLTESNSAGIIALMQKALINCDSKIKAAKKAKTELKKALA